MFKWLTSGDGEGLREVEELFLRMLADDRHVFDLAMAARLGGADPASLRAELDRSEEATDEAERLIRRRLLVHASVRGSADIPACLMYMSLAKDAERVADLSKNMFGVGAIAGPPPPGEIRDELVELRDTVSPMITEAGTIFAADDTEAARDFIVRARELQRRCQRRIDWLVREEHEVPQPAATVLTYRHIGRILANLINIVSAVVMPLDQMDYPKPEKGGGLDEDERRDTPDEGGGPAEPDAL
ncbi:MAG TPA: PhoU domain-containing protein [Egibacteraceae bacterium]|mgnify:CR=1 FL=1